MMKLIPSEFAIGGVYFPPLLIAGILGVAAAAPERSELPIDLRIELEGA